MKHRYTVCASKENLVWCSGVMGMTVPLSGFICNALGLAERQQQKSGSVLIVKIKNLQESIYGNL